MRNWLRETHGPGFELLRHFIRRFFDSDLSTTPDHMARMLVGAIPVFLQWFFLLVLPFRSKYGHLSSFPVPSPYRAAVRADELWLITLMMSAIGLLTAIKWPSLFPNFLDYRALGTLPLRPRQIFGAKLAALLTVALASLLTLNLLPSLLFPVISSSRWAFNPSLSVRIAAHASASLAACAFFFFGLLALQGVLLNLLPPRAFGRLAGNLQGLLVALMLVLIVASFSIQPRITNIVTQLDWSRWLPPVWFLGMYQTLAGDPAPAIHALSHRALFALGVTIVLTFSTYFLSYRRHRTLSVEGVTKSSASHWSVGHALLGWTISDPYQQAVLAFMLKTLARSSYHRMVLLGYGGLAFAFILTGVTADSSSAVMASFVYFHLIALLLLIVATRHLFSLPTELKANWIFQITEGEGRDSWLYAIDKFVLFWGALLMIFLPLPLEIWLLGGRGIEEAILVAASSLLTYEWVFYGWDKLPFTCTRLSGQTPIWMVVAFFGLVVVVSMTHAILLAILDRPFPVLVVVSLLLFIWMRLRRARQKSWGEFRLKFDEAPEPAVRALNLLK